MPQPSPPGQITTKLPSSNRIIRPMRSAAFLLMMLIGGPVAAEQMPLSPADSEVTFRAYGLGLLPFDGKFTRFRGIMRYDPAQPGNCQIMLEIDPSSLAMSDQKIRDDVIGPEFMDVAHYQQMAFEGSCKGEDLAGNLTMHGQAHPFTLELHWTRSRLLAEGRLRRAEWGIDKHPFKVGSTIRIQVTLPNPAVGPRA